VLCGSLRPRVIFLDILMPGIDGIEVANRLPGIKGLDDPEVVFVTSSTNSDLLRRAGSVGHQLLGKPLGVDDLVTTIRRALQVVLR